MRRLWFAGGFLGLLSLVALLAPLLPLADPLLQDVPNRLQVPGAEAWLGKDQVGRDVLSRIVWGARNSLGFAFAAVTIAFVAGTLLGTAGGWFRGWTEIITVRSAEIILCFPGLLFAMLVITLVGSGPTTLVFVMAVLMLPGFVRVAFGQTLSVSGQDYVEAARSLGASTGRIMIRTLLPNTVGPLLVQFSLTVGGAMIMEAGLSFLGLGVVAPEPSWGLMIANARATLETAPWLLAWPCLALMLTILSMNIVCDSLRDVLDPQTVVPRSRRLIDRVLPGMLPAPQAKRSGLLSVTGLTIEIETPRGPVRPVADVSFELAPGEVLAIVGESGSGKSLTAMAVMDLLPPVARPVAGSVRFAGQEMIGLPGAAMRRLRGAAISMVFQDPMSSLHPMHRVGDQVIEAIRSHRRVSRRAAAGEALALFRRVGIADPEERLKAFPHELSGGMRQRVVIAMAIANRPKLLIADEPTTALDVTVQAQILELLAGLRRETGMAMIFISHNLALVAEIADRVAVMYASQIVEQGPVGDVFAAPLHPYTRALLAAVPDDDSVPVGVPGTVPPAHAMPPGCRFAPRCAHSRPGCASAVPPLESAGPGRQVRCLRWEALATGKDAAA